MLTHGIPPDFRGGVHLYILNHIPHRASPEFIGGSRNCVTMALPRVRRHRARSPQGSSSSWCCLCITMDQLMCVSLFPHSGLVRYNNYRGTGEVNQSTEKFEQHRCQKKRTSFRAGHHHILDYTPPLYTDISRQRGVEIYRFSSGWYHKPRDTRTTRVLVGMYVCIFIKLHITAQSGPVIRVILCHSH